MHWEGACMWKNPNPVLLLNKIFYVSILSEHKKTCFTLWVLQQWHGLPTGCRVPCWEVSHSHLDVSGTLHWVLLLGVEWDRWAQSFLPTSAIVWYASNVLSFQWSALPFTFFQDVTRCVSLSDVLSLFHDSLCLLLGSSSAEILCGTKFTIFLNFNYNYATHTIIVNQSALWQEKHNVLNRDLILKPFLLILLLPPSLIMMVNLHLM